MGDHEAPTNSNIFDAAMNRWLEVNELEKQLNPETTDLQISNHPPTEPPLSGTLLLYDRSVTPDYKDDGYEWVKKRNTLSVRENHVKLRVGGCPRVAGCYAHRVNIPTFHRRTYHLLDPETGKAPPSNSADSQPSLVLVHYRNEAPDAAAMFALERGLDATHLSLENNTDRNVLAEIVDFAPKRAFIKRKRQSDIALICSEPLPKKPPDDKIFKYYTFAAFVKLSIAQKNNADLEIAEINLSPLECATPSLYHCTIPSDAVSGKRRIVVVSGYVYQEAGSDFTGVANHVVASLKQSWRNASANTQNSRPSLSSTRNPMIQILTQFSEKLFDLNTGKGKLIDKR